MKNKLNTKSELTESEIQSNYEYFIEFLNQSFTGDRLVKLLAMYSDENLGLQLATAPASTRLQFHCAWAGGYLQHVMHVEKASRGTQKLYAGIGGAVDFTEEERIFSALHHDLGKLGDETGPQYIYNDSKWHIENRGEVYKLNPDIQFMRVPDRALYLLQKYGVTYNTKEMLAIKLSDGLYDDSAKDYYKNYDVEKGLKTSLPYVIHVADLLACRAEHDEWKASNVQGTAEKM